MKKLFFKHATRLLLAFLCIVTGFAQANAATMFVRGTTSPYYKLGSGSYAQMTTSTTAGGVTWYYANVTSGTTVTFATNASGANATPAITFSSSNDSYFYYSSGTGVNLTYQKNYTYCNYMTAGSWWTNDGAVFNCHMHGITNWPGQAETAVAGGSSSSTIYVYTASSTPTGLNFVRMDPNNRTSTVWNKTSDISDIKVGRLYTITSANKNLEGVATSDTYVVNTWPTVPSASVTANIYVYDPNASSVTINGNATTSVTGTNVTWKKGTVTGTGSVSATIAGSITQTKTGLASGDYYYYFDGSNYVATTSSYAPATTYTYNVYVSNSGDNNAPSLWVFNANDLNPAIGDWPGYAGSTTEVINGYTFYKFTFTSTSSAVGLVASVDGNQHQTEDITNVAPGDYYIVFDATQSSNITPSYKGTTAPVSATTYTYNVYVRSSWAPYAHVYYSRGGSDYVLNEGFQSGKAVLSTTETLADGKSWYKLTVTAPTPTISVIFTDGTQTDGVNNQSPTITQSNLTEYYVYNYEDNNNTQANVANNDYRLGVVPMIGKDLYLIGKANGHGWVPNNGIKMTRNGHVYTLENVQLTKASDQDGFAFASVLAESTATENWETVVNPLRLMSHLEHGEAIGESGLGTKHSIERYHADHRNWRMDLNGRFNITVDLDNEYVMIERANEPLYMMGTYYYNGKQYSFAPNDAAEMQTNDGNIYTLSGVSLSNGATFNFVKELTLGTDDAAWKYLHDNGLRFGAPGAVKQIQLSDIGIELETGEFGNGHPGDNDYATYYDFEMATSGTSKYHITVNLSKHTVKLIEMSGGINGMIVRLEKTSNVENPGVHAWDKEAHGGAGRDIDVETIDEYTTGDGRKWWSWRVKNAIADFYFTRTNGSVQQSETLWRRAGVAYYTWETNDELDDETRFYASGAASGVPDCAAMIEGHYYVYFINTPGWENVFCYAWGGGITFPKAGDIYVGYPGVPCELVGYDKDGYEVYRFDFTEYLGAETAKNVNWSEVGIIFDNGVDDKSHEMKDYKDGEASATTTDKPKGQNGDVEYRTGGVYDYLGMLYTGNSLGNLITNGIVDGPLYSIDDRIEVVYFDEDYSETIVVDGTSYMRYGALYCKDLDAFFTTNQVEKSVIQPGEIDYMMTRTNLMTRRGLKRYDQSNWVRLVLSTSYNNNVGLHMTRDQQLEVLRAIPVGSILEASTVWGQLVNNVNPEMHITEMPTIVSGTGNVYATKQNVMIPSNFVGTQNCTEEDYGHYGKNRYFFVTPKPYEYVHITWAVYGGDNKFYAPSRFYLSTGQYPQYYNEGDLDGYFEVDWSYMETNPGTNPNLTSGEVYEFDAIVALNEDDGQPHLSDGAPRRIEHKDAAENAYDYVVYPLNVVANQVITKVTDVETAKTVKAVRYYNVAGVESDQPFDGVNIIVTEYNDGTKTTSKQLR